MELGKEQINNIAKNIFVSDIVDFINTHRSEYEEFLKEEYKGEEVDNEN